MRQVILSLHRERQLVALEGLVAVERCLDFGVDKSR